ncbi:MAG TPA: carboxypeptidase regulatory-like domain-containing protein, partial [Tenuifilaceae bacterium]|nr:carboxypeptidase regulatory-like domain-containing protein [Tenuifilaceae bacterium]
MNCKFLVVLLLAVSLLGLRNLAAQTKNQPAGGRYDLSSFSGSISGQVLDSLTREGVEFASIAIFRQKDSSLVNGTVTDKNGSFKIDKLSPGQYYVDVKFIGYNARRFQGIAVSPRTPE